jgi:hypothetical protein
MADPAIATATAPSAPESTARRRVRNYILDPGLQLRLGGYLVAAAAALSIALGWHVWRGYAEASKLVALGDPRSDEVIAAMLAGEDKARMLWLAAILVGVVLCLLALAVMVTHRIAGPALVMARTCRAVAGGSLARLRPLRQGDLLVGLADEMRAMVEALRAREEEERAALDEAARALAGPGAPARASDIVGRLAAEKARRLEA